MNPPQRTATARPWVDCRLEPVGIRYSAIQLTLRQYVPHPGCAAMRCVGRVEHHPVSTLMSDTVPKVRCLGPRNRQSRAVWTLPPVLPVPEGYRVSSRGEGCLLQTLLN
jgi:hypothetical protein